MPTVRIKNRNLHYIEEGQGYPIIFSHSFVWDREMWRPQIDAFSKNYRCISVDLWEHGQSDHLPETPYSIEQCAEDFEAFTKALGLNSYAFFGLSVGGMIGAHLALRQPQQMKALALVGTYVGSESEEAKQQYKDLLDLFAAGGFSEEIINLFVPFFFSPTTFKTQPHVVDNFKRDLAAIPQDNIAGLVELGHAILLRRQSLLAQLPEIQMPTLVMVGKDDIPRPPSESHEMANLIPNADLAEIPNAGHICSVEQPEQVTQHLQGLLDRMEKAPRQEAI